MRNGTIRRNVLLASIGLLLSSLVNGLALGPGDSSTLPASAAELGQPPQPTATPNTNSGRSKLLVTFQSAPGQSEVAHIGQLGGQVRFRYQLIPTLAVELPDHAVAALRSHPRVLRVEPDAQLQAFDHGPNTGIPELEAAWGVEHIGAGAVHAASHTGPGVKVMIADTGIASTHPELTSAYAGGVSFVPGVTDPADDNGHGTHVAGIVAAAANSTGVVGVAPNAQLYAAKVLDANGSGDYSYLIAALEWAILNNMQVVNMSLGGSVDSTDLHAMITNAYNAGIVLAAASGNVTNIFEVLFGCPVRYPAAYSEAIATTNAGQTDQLTGSSCTGAQVDISAPGEAIHSTVPTGTCPNCNPSGYATFSGTSMASPHVAGTAALLLAQGIPDSNGNGRRNDDVKDRLCSTASPAGGMATTDPRYPNWYGCGILNADGAALGITPPPPSLTNTPTATGTATLTATSTPSPTQTATPTQTLTPSHTATQTLTPTFSPTGTPSASPTATLSPTTTLVASSTATASPSPTATATPAGPLNTGLVGPGSSQAGPGGDGNGFQLNPANALFDDGFFAEDRKSGTASSQDCTSPARDRHVFSGFNLGLPPAAVVQGIEVRLDARADNAQGSPRMCVELSWDGGNSWASPPRTTASTLSTTEATYLLGGAADTWGRSWAPSDLFSTNFRVRITNVASSTSRDFFLDWIAVRVTYQ